MRIIIWHALVARGILSGMLLVFSLLAISLVWSVGQRVDVWAFLLFNLRGSRPVWLDWMMLGFTQIGSAAAALVIGLILFLAGNRLLAYEFILGSLTLWITAFFGGDSDAHCRLPGWRAIFPKRAYQPGVLHGDADGPVFPRQRLGGIYALRHCPVGGYHAHVCGCALPTGCAGWGYSGQCLGTSGSTCQRVCAEWNRVKRITPRPLAREN
jgi:hypothetical protein